MRRYALVYFVRYMRTWLTEDLNIIMCRWLTLETCLWDFLKFSKMYSLCTTCIVIRLVYYFKLVVRKGLNDQTSFVITEVCPTWTLIERICSVNSTTQISHDITLSSIRMISHFQCILKRSVSIVDR